MKATINGKTVWQLREINSGEGWSGNPLEAHFGLGDATNVETLRIEWPSGTVQELQNLSAKQFLTLTEPPRLQIAPPQLSNPTKLTLRGGIGFTYALDTSSDLQTWLSLRTNTPPRSRWTSRMPTPRTSPAASIACDCSGNRETLRNHPPTMPIPGAPTRRKRTEFVRPAASG